MDSNRDGFRTAGCFREVNFPPRFGEIADLTVEIIVQYPYKERPHEYASDRVAAEARRYTLFRLIQSAANKAQEELNERFE